MIDVSGTFANALKENLASRGASADVYINKERDRNIRGFAAKILAHKLHHALIQVGIARGDKGDLYLKPVYNPLEFRSDNAGMETYTALPGIDERYQILSAADPRSPMPGFSKLAAQFADRLRQKGYLGK